MSTEENSQSSQTVKPLFKKPLHTAPPRWQQIMIKIQGCNYTVKYRQGKTMVIADTISGLPNMARSEEIEVINEIQSNDQESANISLLRFTPTKQEKL